MMSWRKAGEIAGQIADKALFSMATILRLAGFMLLAAIFILVSSPLGFPLQIIWAVFAISAALLFRYATNEIPPFGLSQMRKSRKDASLKNLQKRA